MVFGKKKTKEVLKEVEAKKAEQEKPTETVEAKAVSPEVKKRVDSLLKEFNENYNGLTTPSEFPQASLQTNILLGILSELIRIRKSVEEE